MKPKPKRRYKLFTTVVLLLSIGLQPIIGQPELGQCEQEVEEVVSNQLPKAQKAWQANNFREAERYLEKAVRLDKNYAHALYLLGELMLRKKEFLKAEALFAKLLEVCPQYKAEVNYFLGVLYQEGGKLEKAIPLLEAFLTNPERDFGYDREVKAALKEARLEKNLKANPVVFNPQPVQKVSTPADEYLATISPDQQNLFFTRRSRKVNRRDGPAARVRLVEEFSQAQRLPGGDFEMGKPLPSPFNTSFNEGGPSITANNTELYFTVCEDIKGYQNCDIYYAERDAYGYWTTPRSVGDHINRRNSWESQPSVSANGDVLYFTSNREGGIGKLDLYRCFRKEDGTWSKPKILDATVNTKGNEKTPFIHSDSRTLYFTSDGHPGLGGFDIFYVQSQDTSWGSVKNIGYPINGEEDDLGLFVSLNGQTAYFASNKIRANAGWDLYQFDLPEQARPEEVALISGTLTRDEGEEMHDAAVEIKNLKTRQTTKIKVDEETGNFARVVTARENEDLIVTVKKKGAAFSSRYIAAKNLQKQRVVKTPLTAAKIEVGRAYTLNDINFETNSYQLSTASTFIMEEFVTYLKENPRLKADIQGHTDNVGDPASNKTLSTQRAKTVYNYVVSKGISAARLSYHGYGETKPIASNATEEGRAQNRRTVFEITAR
jgi:outer membrane protein OmpA-like peptidoglycan-associated protein/tetratricopeptide (TPR) repeat protein